MIKTKEKNGYITVIAKDHPRAYYGKVYEHIIVMEKYLGCFLPKGAIVHHKNLVRDDNRLENLLLLRNRNYHVALHSAIENGDTAIVQALEVWSKEFMANLKTGLIETENFSNNEACSEISQTGDDDVENFVARRNKVSNKAFLEFEDEFLISPDGKEIELDTERFGETEEVLKTELTERQLKVYENRIKAKVAKEIKDEKNQELQRKLFIELKRERMRLASKNNLPAYVVFEDKTLIEMSEIMPVTESGMLHVWGMGPIKFQQYGRCFIEVIQKFKSDYKIGAD